MVRQSRHAKHNFNVTMSLQFSPSVVHDHPHPSNSISVSSLSFQVQYSPWINTGDRRRSRKDKRKRKMKKSSLGPVLYNYSTQHNQPQFCGAQLFGRLLLLPRSLASNSDNLIHQSVYLSAFLFPFAGQKIVHLVSFGVLDCILQGEIDESRKVSIKLS